MITRLLPLLLALALPAALFADTHLYRDGGQELEGELFTPPAGQAVRGGVVVFHQWTGLSDHERAAARRLAGEGFVVLCADVYGKGIRPQAPADCMAEVKKYKGDRPLLRQRALAALRALRDAGGLKPAAPVVAIGYCFGGTTALELARVGADVVAVVSFHGGLDAPLPAAAGQVKARVLALHGQDDPYVPPAEVDGFEQEMKAAGVNYRLVRYPGAVHSFTLRSAGSDPSKGAAYQAEADQQSWAELRRVLAEQAPAR